MKLVTGGQPPQLIDQLIDATLVLRFGGAEGINGIFNEALVRLDGMVAKNLSCSCSCQGREDGNSVCCMSWLCSRRKLCKLN